MEGLVDMNAHYSVVVPGTLKHISISVLQFWKSYIKRPMILVGPSLGAAVAIDFVVNHPEAVS